MSPAEPGPSGPTLADDTVLVLDIDDTLYLEANYVRSGFEAVGCHLQAVFGISDSFDMLWADFISGVRGNAFDRVLRANDIPPDERLIADLVDVYRSHQPSIGLAPDAEALLRRLEGRPAAAITDGPRESQHRKIAALGLDRFLAPIIVTAELGQGRGKPHHRAFELVEHSLDTAPSRCCYIADNPLKDFVAPLARGWGAIRVRRPSSLHHGRPTPFGVCEVPSLASLRADDQSPPFGGPAMAGRGWVER